MPAPDFTRPREEKTHPSLLRSADRYRSIIISLTQQELLRRYAGSVIGAVWVVVQPVLLVLTYWFVFSIALKIRVDGSTPFLVVFIAGLIPWLTFQEVVTQSAFSITSNPHLVKKIVFPVEVLPVVHLCVALIGQGVMLGILCGLLLLTGHSLGIHALEILYYACALSVIAVALGWLVAALNVFARDTAQAISSILTVWFWLTPVVWPVSALPTGYRWVAEANPLWYIVHGYRKALILGEPFWTDPGGAARFWLVALILAALGFMTFRRLKHEFADLL